MPEKEQFVNQSVVYSDHEHIGKKTRRQNLVDFFLHGIEADRYISTHLYGEFRKVKDEEPDDTVNESMILENILSMSMQNKMPLLQGNETMGQTMIK